MDIPLSSVIVLALILCLVLILALSICVWTIMAFRNTYRELRYAQEILLKETEHRQAVLLSAIEHTEKVLLNAIERPSEYARRWDYFAYTNALSAQRFRMSDRFRFEGRELESIVDAIAAEHEITLTPGAIAMLTVPMMEERFGRDKVSIDQYRKSVDMLLRFASAEGRRRDLPGRERDSISVIHGFSQYFCSIPPFCSPDPTSRQQ